MIFPEIEDVKIIDAIREKCDPLAGLVRPHITIVFPFESPMSNGDIEEILAKRLNNIKPFELVLNGMTKSKDQFGNYLFLDVKKGNEEITAIHDILYGNEFREYNLGLGYKPHMTVGKLPTVEALETAYEEVKAVDINVRTVVDKISVEMIGENEESIIIVEHAL